MNRTKTVGSRYAIEHSLIVQTEKCSILFVLK